MKTVLLFFSFQSARLSTMLSLLSEPPDGVLLDQCELPPLPPGMERVFACHGQNPSEIPDLWGGYAPLVPWLAEQGYELILLPGDPDTDLLAASLSVALNGCTACGVTSLRTEGGALCIRRGVCGLELEGEFVLPALPAVLTMDTPAVSAPPTAFYNIVPISLLCAAEPASVPVCSSLQNDIPPTAGLVLIAGRGADSRYEQVKLLAGRLNGWAGATRPLVFEGRAPLSALVGASAAVLSPELCVVFGASGSAAFSVGVEQSRILVGVNLDRDAPLFDNCDWGAIRDCNDILDALLKLTQQEVP